jgi:hypothetical protein
MFMSIILPSGPYLPSVLTFALSSPQPHQRTLRTSDGILGRQSHVHDLLPESLLVDRLFPELISPSRTALQMKLVLLYRLHPRLDFIIPKEKYLGKGPFTSP